MSMHLLSTILIYIAAALSCCAALVPTKRERFFSYFQLCAVLIITVLAINNGIQNFTTFNILTFLIPLPTAVTCLNFEFKNQKIAKFSKIIEGAALFLSAILISVCGLIIGKESVYSYLIALPVAVLLFAVYFFKNRKNGLINVLGCSLAFLSAGLLFGQILAVLLYDLSILNILFAFGCILFGVYCILTTYTKNRYIKIILFLSLILFASLPLI